MFVDGGSSVCTWATTLTGVSGSVTGCSAPPPSLPPLPSPPPPQQPPPFFPPLAPGEALRPTISAWMLLRSRRLPNGQPDLDIGSFRRRMASQWGVSADELQLNVDELPLNVSIASSSAADSPALASFSRELNVTVLAMSNLYRSFCLAPAPPPSPPPPAAPPPSALTKDARDAGELIERLRDPAVGTVQLAATPGGYEVADADALAGLCAWPRRGLTLEAPPGGASLVRLRLALSSPVDISCPVRLVRLNVSIELGALRVPPDGSLTLAGASVLAGTLENSGLVRYELPAPLGTYLPGGTMRSCDTATEPCEYGATRLLELRGSTSEPSVTYRLPLPCLAGYLGDSTGGDDQLHATCARSCPKGRYCLEGSVNATACPGGTFNPTAGGSSSEGCIACPKGSSCPEGSIAPSLCLVNFFQDETGQSSCNKCRDGEQYCLRNGTVTPEPVPCDLTRGSAQYYLDEHIGCLLCPIGSSCDGRHRTKCPPGSHSTELGEAQCTRW